MIKILQVVTTYQSVVTILNTKLRSLEKMDDVDVVVVSSSIEEGEHRESACPHYVIEIKRTIDLLEDIKAIKKLIKFCKTYKPDIIHTHTAKAGIIGSIAGLFCRAKVIHSYHGLPFYKGLSPVKYLLYKNIEMFFSNFRDLIFSQNREDFKTLKKLFSGKRDIRFEGNGVDIPFIQELARNEVFEKPFSDEEIIVTCVSRLEGVKKVETVIEMVKALHESGINLKCLIAGKGLLKDHYQKMIDGSGLSSNIRIVYTSKITSLIKQSDIVVLASEKEGVPRALMEAMVLEKPVVATNVLGTKELVEDQSTGYLVPLGDQDAFNNAVTKLIKDSELRKSMGEAGLVRIKKYFNEDDILKNWLETYNEILDK